MCGDLSGDTEQHKKDVLYAFQQTEDEVYMLTKQLKELASIHADFADRLAHHPESRIYKVGEETHGFSVEQFDPRNYLALTNPDKAFVLADELRVAKRQLTDLGWEKQKLGLR